MVRHYKRKTSRGNGYSWTTEALHQAIDAVESKSMTISAAAKAFSIPFSTLFLKLKGWKGRNSTRLSISGGMKTSLTLEEEGHLAMLLKTMNKWGFGLTKREVLNCVQEYVIKNNLSSRFKNNRPGKDWFHSFCERHQLSVKKPELHESSRARQSNDPFVIYGFFDIVSNVIQELGLVNKPESIFNADESGFRSDAVSTKVVAGRGQPAKRVSSGNGRKCTTVLACVSASGRKLAPMILHQGKRLWDSMFGNNAYPGTSYFVTENGWMAEPSFGSWFTTQFLPQVPDRPALLILDGHLSHVGIDMIETALKEQVTILKLPPHTSHILQPLDKTVFYGLKLEWDELIAKWTKANRGKNLSKSDFADIFGEAWKGVRSEVIKSGFKSCGIFDSSLPFPVNPTCISEENFDPEKLARYKKLNSVASQNAHQLESGQTHSLQKNPGQASSTPSIPEQVESTQVNPETVQVPQVSVTQNEPSTLPVSPKLKLKFEPEVVLESAEIIPNRVASSFDQNSFESILLRTVTPSSSDRPRKRKRIDVAEVITKEDYLENLKGQKSTRKGTKNTVSNKKARSTVNAAKSIPLTQTPRTRGKRDHWQRSHMKKPKKLQESVEDRQNNNCL